MTDAETIAPTAYYPIDTRPLAGEIVARMVTDELLVDRDYAHGFMTTLRNQQVKRILHLSDLGMQHFLSWYRRGVWPYGNEYEWMCVDE